MRRLLSTAVLLAQSVLSSLVSNHCLDVVLIAAVEAFRTTWEGHGEVEAWKSNGIMGEVQEMTRLGHRGGPQSDLLFASLANLVISYNVVKSGKALHFPC